MSSNTKTKTEERRFTVIKPEKGIELVDDFRDGLKRDMSMVEVGESFVLNKKQRPLVGSYSKKLGMKFKTRALTESPDEMRVWRIE
tara:strand:+ start:160 stop:417 length:258 start_codon:yes stop_codon:yes gene_type:complete